MKKPISKNLHGVIDYTYATVVPFIPVIADFTEEEEATALCRMLGTGALTYTAFTKSAWGIYKIIPFKAHLVMDFTISLFALSSPWLFKFANNKKARNTVIAIGLAGLAASMLTNPCD